MSSKETYAILDTIKLAMDSSAMMLEVETDKLSEANYKSINQTISEAHRKLREVLSDITKDTDE